MSNRAEKADILSNHEQTCQDLALIANYHSGGNFKPEALDGIKHLIYLSTGNDTFNYDAAPINVIIEAIHHGAILTQNKINEEQRQLDEENRTSLVNDFNALHVSDAQYSFTKDSVKFLAALNQNCSNLSALLDMSEKSTPKAHKIIADRIDKDFNEGRF